MDLWHDVFSDFVFYSKKMMKKMLAGMCAVLVLGGCGVEKNDDVLKVGVILPLSGEAASMGNAFKNGMEMALENLDEKTRAKMELVWEDDGLQAAKTVTAFKKLADVDGIDMVINISSGTSNAIAPLAESKQMPFLAVGSDKEIVEGRDWVVKLWVSAENEVGVMVPEVEKRGMKKLAQITAVQAGFILVRDIFDEAILGKEIEVILKEDVLPDVKDFRSFIAKIKGNSEVEGIEVNLMFGQLGLFAKQVREAGIEVPIFGFEVFEDANEVKLSNGALVGEWFVNGDDPDPDFERKYWENFPGASFFTAPNGHDAIALIGAAIEEVGIDPAKINEWLHNVEGFQGALGTFSASGRNDFTLPAAVKIVTEDGFEKLYK